MKCELCGNMDECKEVDGVYLCEECLSRRYEKKEYAFDLVRIQMDKHTDYNSGKK